FGAALDDARDGIFRARAREWSVFCLQRDLRPGDEALREVRGWARDARDLDRTRDMPIGRLDPARVGRKHGERVVHDEHADEVLRELRGGERFLIMPGRGVLVAERAIDVPEPLM